MTPDRLRDLLRRIVHAASAGLFSGLLVLGLGYLATGMVMPLIQQGLADPSPEAAFSAYLRGLVLIGVAVSVAVGMVTWWRIRR